jgi:predicted transcriptional regulator
MALTITLPQDLEKQLREMAADRESVESLVASAVRQYITQTSADEALAESR